MYRIVFSNDAIAEYHELKRKAPNAIKKLTALLKELQEHPRQGTGQAERLKHYEGEVWSRRITKEHRIVYRIYEDRIEVLVLSVFGHYRK